MKRRRHTPEQIIRKLRTAEQLLERMVGKVLTGNGISRSQCHGGHRAPRALVMKR
jgi:hypothetical protein